MMTLIEKVAALACSMSDRSSVTLRLRTGDVIENFRAYDIAAPIGTKFVGSSDDTIALLRGMQRRPDGSASEHLPILLSDIVAVIDEGTRDFDDSKAFFRKYPLDEGWEQRARRVS
jgi:hypothetical protein